MNMVTYIGTRVLEASPMTRGEYNAYRGWTVPENEDPADAGYLVEHLNGGHANDSRHADYISWSPADVFERAYTPLEQHAQAMEPALDFLRAHAAWCAGELSQPQDEKRAEALREVQASCLAAVQALGGVK